MLQEWGLNWLSTRAELDKEEIEREVEEEKATKLREALREHEEWVNKRDSLKIRMPPPKEIKNPSLCIGIGSGKVKKPVKTAQNSLDMLRSSGYKYIHAKDEAELKQIRETLLKKGYVYPENLRGEEMDEYQIQQAMEKSKTRQRKEEQVRPNQFRCEIIF